MHDMPGKREMRQRRGDGRGEPLSDGSRRFPTPKGTFVPAPAPRRGGASKGEERARRGEEVRDLAWRRTGEERGDMPAWMAEDAGTPRTPGGRVDSIQEFKAQLRERERREKGEPEPEQAQQRGMYEDLAQPEESDGHSSRFAKFFHSDQGKGDAQASNQAAVEIDLFSLLSGKKEQKPSSAASTPAAPAPPALAPAPKQAPSAPQTPQAAPAGGAPSAADMASMQMLMAKLMGGRTQSPAATPPRASSGTATPSAPPSGAHGSPAPAAQAAQNAPSQMALFQQLLHQSSRPRDGDGAGAGAPPGLGGGGWPMAMPRPGAPPGGPHGAHPGGPPGGPPGLYGAPPGVPPQGWPGAPYDPRRPPPGLGAPPGVAARPPGAPPGLAGMPGAPPGMHPPPAMPYAFPGHAVPPGWMPERRE